MTMYQNKIPYTTCLLSICIANNIQACDVRKRPLFLILVRQFHKHIYKYSAILIAAVYHLYRSYADCICIFAYWSTGFFLKSFCSQPSTTCCLGQPCPLRPYPLPPPTPICLTQDVVNLHPGLQPLREVRNELTPSSD